MAGAFLPDVNAIAFFYKVCGLSIHTWVALILCLLVVLKVLPDMGEMKRQQELSSRGVNVRKESEGPGVDAIMGGAVEPDWFAFFWPMGSMIGFMVITSLMAGEIVVVPSAFLSAITTAIYVSVKHKMSFRTFGNELVAGCLE